MAAAVRILGLDPGLNHTGWGIIDTTGAKSIWVASGVFDIPKGETAARLAHIAREIEAVIKTHLPTVAACERECQPSKHIASWTRPRRCNLRGQSRRSCG